MSAPPPDFNYVYILQSRADAERSQIGITPNLAYALAEHNAGHIQTSAFHRPWDIRLAIAFRDGARAEQFEQYLKTSSGRAFAKRHF